jgi:uncharacterized protein (TIGR02266 family)
VEPKRTILIADDTAMFRELGSLFLARSGRVFTASDGRECLEVARQQRPSVVVADLDMPGMGGEELCQRLKRDPDLRDVPVILLTSSDRAEDRARAVRAGADDVVSKPISRTALIQAVNRFLRGARVRGLARVDLETRVQIVHERREYWGTARNLSRGGIFVEAECSTPRHAEVTLEFRLPEIELALSPTAQVIWRREPLAEQPRGLGLQFLALDRESAAAIDAFVYERAPAPRTLDAGLRAQAGTR